MYTFQPSKRLGVVLQAELTVDPLVAIQRVRIPDQPGDPDHLCSSSGRHSITHYEYAFSLTSHASHY